MVLRANFGCGTRSGRDKGISMAKIPSIITNRGEEVRKLSTAGSRSTVNILSPEEQLNYRIVTIQIGFRPKIKVIRNVVLSKKLQSDLEVPTKRDERARGRELKRFAGERQRKPREEIEFKKQILDEPGQKSYRHFLRCRISSGYQAQQYRPFFCIC